MNLVHQKETRNFSVLLLNVCCTVTLVSACQKSPAPEEPAGATIETTSDGITTQPTGLVKAPVPQTGQTKDVNKWLDQFSAKTSAQIAQEEKQIKDAKLAQDAKLAAEAKAREAKASASQRDASRTATAALTVAPVATAKTPEVVAPSPVSAVAAVTPKPLPSPAPEVAEPSPLKLLTSVQPSFPRGAIRANITEGVVNARIHIGTDGKVSQVDIVKAKPARHFDQEVITAAMQWKYAPISSPQTRVMEFHFNRDN